MGKNSKRILIFGGSTHFGMLCVKAFKSSDWIVMSVDKNANTEANENILLDDDIESIAKLENKIFRKLDEYLNDTYVDFVICLTKQTIWNKNNCSWRCMAEITWENSIKLSVLAGAMAKSFLKPHGVFVILSDCDYSQKKHDLGRAAIHQLVKSLADYGSGMPANSIVIFLLAKNLNYFQPDGNIPNAKGDISTWTPSQFVTSLLLRWSKSYGLPISGTLCHLQTHNFITDVVYT